MASAGKPIHREQRQRRGVAGSLFAVARAGLVGYLLIMLGLLLLENSLVYPAPPSTRGDWSPAGLDQQDVYFESADGVRLHGWYLEHPEPAAQVLFCHGNGEHVADLSPLLEFLRDRLHVSIFAFDYRGYGRSKGSPQEEGILADASAAQGWLAEQAGIELDEVVVMGRSLGGGVAVDLAANNGARGLILESTFTSLPDAAAELYFWVPVKLLMRNQMNSLEKIDRYDGPLLQVHGTADRVVSYKLGVKLFEAAPSQQKQFIKVDGGTHHSALPVEYYRTLADFVVNLPPIKAAPDQRPAPSMLNQVETSLVYPAPRYPEGDWNPVGLGQEDVYFESADGTKLHGWFVEHPDPRAVVLYAHGNGEHVAWQAPLLVLLRDRLRVSAFAYDYRGYGRSEGTPDEAGLLADGRAARDWLAKRTGIENKQVVLMGRSLGGAVAVDTAATGGARGLILESTFTSMTDVAARHFPWAPVRTLMRNRFESINRIEGYQGPLLMSHGAADGIVPYELGRRLFDASPSEQKEFFEIPGGDHNEPSPPEYYAALDRFLERLPN